MNAKRNLKFFIPIILLFSCVYFYLTKQIYGQKPIVSFLKKEKNKQSDSIALVKANWEPFILGDINNDSITDTAFVYTPAYYESSDPKHKEDPPLFSGCINDSCYNRIKFSNKLPEINYSNSLWGRIEVIEDLDNDNIKEILYERNWFIGSHVSITIYSFNISKNEWVILAKNYLYVEDSYKHRIKKINSKKFKFKVEYMDTIERDIKNKNIIVEIKK